MTPCAKKSFDTGQEANERSVIIRNEEKEKGNRVVLRPYKCDRCGKYHLTSKTKAEWDKERIKTPDEITKIREEKFIKTESNYFIKKFKLKDL